MSRSKYGHVHQVACHVPPWLKWLKSLLYTEFCATYGVKDLVGIKQTKTYPSYLNMPDFIHYSFHYFTSILKCRLYFHLGSARPIDKDNCFWKDSLLLTGPKRRGHATSWDRGAHGEAPGPVRRQRGCGDMWARASAVTPMRGNGPGRLCGFRIGQFV